MGKAKVKPQLMWATVHEGRITATYSTRTLARAYRYSDETVVRVSVRIEPK